MSSPRLRDALVQIAGPLIGLALVLLIFGAWRPDRFLTADAFENISKSSYHIAVAAVGATFVIVTGGIDLSVGSTMALASVCCALALTGFALPPFQAEQAAAISVSAALLVAICATGRLLQNGRSYLYATAVGLLIAAAAGLIALGLWWTVAGRSFPMLTRLLPGDHLPVIAALLIGTLVGALVGLINGRLITDAALPPFIVTLATLGAVRGLALYLTSGVTISSLPNQIDALHFSELVPNAAQRFGPAFRFLSLPPNVWITLAVVLVGIPALHFTVFGRYALAIGSNERTARLCGVRVERWKTLCYVIAGACAGLAGVMMTGKFTNGQPTEFRGAELDVIAAVVIGGTSLFGGEGSVLGSFLGVLMLSVLYSGCNIAGVTPFVQQIFIGATILLAAALDRFRHLRR